MKRLYISMGQERKLIGFKYNNFSVETHEALPILGNLVSNVPEWGFMKTVCSFCTFPTKTPTRVCKIQTPLASFPWPSLLASPFCLFFPKKECWRGGYWDSFKLKSYLSINTTPGWGRGKLPCSKTALGSFVFQRDIGWWGSRKGEILWERLRTRSRKTDRRVTVPGTARKRFLIQMI